MKCVICNKDFEAKRNDAKFCSVTCRSKQHRATDKSATDNATDKLSVAEKVLKVSPLKLANPELYCKVESCNLHNMPGHGGMCIYHWRQEEKISTIEKEEYDLLNVYSA